MTQDIDRKMMRGLLVAGIAMFGLLMNAPLAAQSNETLDELETVVVTGEQPGPGLWRVSKGGHVMWVLGTHEPLPKKMTWRSRNVEARIAESQAVLLPGTIDIDMGVGFFRALSLLPTLIKTAMLPDRKTLQDVLPPAIYQKWRHLHEKYIGRGNQNERLRPMFAIEELRDKAYQKSQLKDGPVVDAIVKTAAKKRRVRIQRLPDVQRSMKVTRDDLRIVMDNLRSMPDVQCFTQDLGHLESDIEQLKALANAWARGNIETLRQLTQQPEAHNACDNAFDAAILADGSANAARMKALDTEYRQNEAQAKAQAQREWIAAARKVIDKNPSTFAALPIREVVGITGYIAELKTLGYQVEGP